MIILNLVDESKHVSLRAGTPNLKTAVSKWIYRTRICDACKVSSYQWLLLISMTLIVLTFLLKAPKTCRNCSQAHLTILKNMLRSSFTYVKSRHA